MPENEKPMPDEPMPDEPMPDEPTEIDAAVLAAEDALLDAIADGAAPQGDLAAALLAEVRGSIGGLTSRDDSGHGSARASGSGPRGRHRPGRGIWGASLGVAIVVAAGGGLSAAATDRLPAPVQRIVNDVAQLAPPANAAEPTPTVLLPQTAAEGARTRTHAHSGQAPLDAPPLRAAAQPVDSYRFPQASHPSPAPSGLPRQPGPLSPWSPDSAPARTSSPTPAPTTSAGAGSTDDSTRSPTFQSSSPPAPSVVSHSSNEAQTHPSQNAGRPAQGAGAGAGAHSTPPSPSPASPQRRR